MQIKNGLCGNVITGEGVDGKDKWLALSGSSECVRARPIIKGEKAIWTRQATEGGQKCVITWQSRATLNCM